MYGYIDPLEQAHEQSRRLHAHHQAPPDPCAGPGPAPLFAPSADLLGGPAQYISPYQAMLGLPPGQMSAEIANVMGPMEVEQWRAEARRAQYGAQGASGCAAVFLFVLAFAATAGTVLAAGVL